MTQPFLITVELPDSSPRSIRSNVRRPVVRILVPIVKLRQGESHKNFNLKPLSEERRTQGDLGGIGLEISLILRRLSASCNPSAIRYSLLKFDYRGGNSSRAATN